MIERQLRADTKPCQLFQAVKSAPSDSRDSARKALADYLTGRKKWSAAGAALPVEYATLAPAPVAAQQTNGVAAKGALSRGFFWLENDQSLLVARQETAWAVQAIGEQKATQWLTLPASEG